MNTETWYLVSHWSGCNIQPIQVVKETEKSVTFIDKRWNPESKEISRVLKSSSDTTVCKTLDEAKTVAYQKIDSKIRKCEVMINSAKADRVIIEGIKEQSQ